MTRSRLTSSGIEALDRSLPKMTDLEWSGHKPTGAL